MPNLLLPPQAAPMTRTQVIDLQLQRAAQAQLLAYKVIREQLFGPESKPFAPEVVQANVADWEANTTMTVKRADGSEVNLTFTQLQQAAKAAKANLNLFQVTVTDDVVPAAITFP